MRYELIPGRVLKLPSGITVGDEFRIAGRARVIAIAEELVDITSFPGGTDFAPGESTIRLFVTDIEADSTEAQ